MEAYSAGNKRCLESLAWFAGAATTGFLTVYNAVEKHQLEHLPPDKVTVVGGLIGLALFGGSAKRFEQGIKLRDTSVIFDKNARAKRAQITFLEAYLD